MDSHKQDWKSNAINTLIYYAKLLYQTRKSFFAAYIITIIFNGVLPVINVILEKELVESVIDKSIKTFSLYTVIIVAINLFSMIIINRLSNVMNSVYELVQNDFQIKISDKITKLNLETIESGEFHDQLEKAKTGISWYSGGIVGITNNVSLFISSIITICGTLTIIVKFSISVVFFIILTSILNIVVTALAQKRDANFRKRLVTVNRKLGYFLNIFTDRKITKEVRLYKADELIEEKVNNFLDTEWKEERKRTTYGNKIRVLIDVINYANQTFLYLFFAWKTIRKAITISSFTIYLNAGITFYNGIINVTTQYIEIEKNSSFLKEYMTFMQLPERNKQIKYTNILPHKIKTIEFKNVSFRYSNSEKFALENVSVKINVGEKISLIGPNGAGKTTFIKLLCGLYEPTFGEILIDGVPLSQYDEMEYLKKISAVFQDYKDFAFTIAENIAVDNVDIEKLYSVLDAVELSAKIRALSKMENTNFSKEFDESGVEFSGGEKQRIAIARALYKDAEFIILDEPTASLDPLAEQQIFQLFKKIIDNRTAIFISHRMSSCLLCDRVILFENGKIAASGKHSSMLNNELYSKMWEAQSKYYV